MSEMRRVILLFVALAGLAVVVLTSCGGGSQQTNTPTNSTPSIAFMKEDSDGFWQTWVANKDLSDQVKLTSGSADSGWAVWKPGGAKLAFESNHTDPDPTDSEAINDIFKMNPDGTGVVKLTDSKSFNSGPGWSPGKLQRRVLERIHKAPEGRMTRRDLEVRFAGHGRYTSSNLRRALLSLERMGHIILEEGRTLDQSYVALPPLRFELLSDQVISELLAQIRARS